MSPDTNLEIMTLIIKVDYTRLVGRPLENLLPPFIVALVVKVYEKKCRVCRKHTLIIIGDLLQVKRKDCRQACVRISGNKGRFIALRGETSRARSRGC